MNEEVYYERCAGIDVHKKVLVVCLRIGRKSEVRTFGTLTHEIRSLAVWLKNNGCQMAAMESTGSYWKPLYNIFEQENLPAMVSRITLKMYQAERQMSMMRNGLQDA